MLVYCVMENGKLTAIFSKQHDAMTYARQLMEWQNRTYTVYEMMIDNPIHMQYMGA